MTTPSPHVLHRFISNSFQTTGNAQTSPGSRKVRFIDGLSKKTQTQSPTGESTPAISCQRLEETPTSASLISRSASNVEPKNPVVRIQMSLRNRFLGKQEPEGDIVAINEFQKMEEDDTQDEGDSSVLSDYESNSNIMSDSADLYGTSEDDDDEDEDSDDEDYWETPASIMDHVPASLPSLCFPDRNTPTVVLHYGSRTEGTRTRIRKRYGRKLEFEEDIWDEMKDQGSPLLSPDELTNIRRNGWKPYIEDDEKELWGNYYEDVDISHHSAWDIGKRGCLALHKLLYEDTRSNSIREEVGPCVLVMDGTDFIAFLTVFRSQGNERPYKYLVYSAVDLQYAIWTPSRKKVTLTAVNPTKRKQIASFEVPSYFFDSMLICLGEMSICCRVRQLVHTRRQEERKLEAERKTSSTASGAATAKGQPRSYRGLVSRRRQSVAAITSGVTERGKSRSVVAPRMDVVVAQIRANVTSDHEVALLRNNDDDDDPQF